VGNYRLSGEADADVEEIAETSLQPHCNLTATSLQYWGLARAERSVFDLRAAFQRLADFPDWG
jgi:plasmid stabilization system protein ParE